MDFKEFYTNISETEKLRYLKKLLASDLDLQKDFKNKVTISPLEDAVSKPEKDVSFADMVVNYTQKFEGDFSVAYFSDVDWDDISSPSGYYVEEWELVENYFSDQVAELFVPIKDVFIELLINAKYCGILAALCALYDVCQNLEIDDSDYCTIDCVKDSFSNGCVDLVKFIADKTESILGPNKNIDDALFQFFMHFFSKHENNHSFEKEIQELIYVLIIKSDNSVVFYDVFAKNNFTIFPKISSYLIDKNSSVENWLDFALKSYQKEISIAEKLLIHLHKTDTKKFISIAFSLIKNPLTYKREDFYKYEIDDIYYAEYGWNEFLYPLLNYKEHELLFIIVNLNIANRNDKIEHYLKVREYLDEAQKQKFIDVVHQSSFKIRIYIVENQIDKAKDIILQNTSLSQLISLLSPFRELEPEFCFNFIISFIDDKIKTERGRRVYSEISEILVFATNLEGFGATAKQFAIKLCSENNRLSALKDEFKKKGLI